MLKRFVIVAMIALLGLCISKSVVAKENVIDGYDFYAQTTPEMTDMYATAYCINGQTATGCYTRPGICAGKREWFGKTLAVYLDDNGEVGEFLGYYECLDTGGETIRTGRVLDIWMPTESECFAFGSRRIWITVIEGEG